MTKLSYFVLYLSIIGHVFSKPGYISKRTPTPVPPSKLVDRDERPLKVPVHINIELTQPNIEPFVSSLLQISDPTSPSYGRYWTAQDVARAFKPADETSSSVMHWLRDSGVTPDRLSRCQSGHCIGFQSTTAEASQLLHTRFHHFRYKETGSTVVSCDEYFLPQSMESYIEYITFSFAPHASEKSLTQRRASAPLVHGRRNQNDSQWSIDCAKSTVPSCLREFYNIPNSTVPHPNNSFGIYQPAGVTWLAEDMDLFFSQYQPSLTGKYPEVQSIDGGYMQTAFQVAPFNLEPNLDFQYAMALVDPQPVVNIQVGDLFLGGNFNNMLAAFDKFYCGSLDPLVDPIFPSSNSSGGYNKSTDCGTLKPPAVLSISYSDTEAAFPTEYLERQCTEFLKLGLLGTTVIVSSGDAGVEGGIQPGTCINTTTGVSNATNTGRFSPGWPAACPWVTTVGATQRFVCKNTSGNWTGNWTSASMLGNKPLFGETALFRKSKDNLTTLSSGGGFSNVFGAPPYQADAIADYIEQEHEHLAHLGWTFKRDGRGFPDLSALGESYLIAMYGNVTTVHGTSASAPVVASMISLINNDRLAAGKSTVGFINPALYSNPNIFNDVVAGSNDGCGFRVAFPASNGWDPVTGLGTMNYQKARDMFMSLP